MTLDGAGNVYGMADEGGQYKAGTLYELTPSPNGGWVRTVIHQFAADGVDGGFPYDNPTIDESGNLFGTTRGGGPDTEGIVFEFSPNGNGTYSSKILQSFTRNGPAGGRPYGGIVLDSAGNLYGSTSTGPETGVGTAYEITP